MDKFDNQKLTQLIKLFLQVNPQPSDQQFHAFAESLGVDKETLEAIAYDMLSEDVNGDQEVEAVSTHFPEGEEEEDFGIVNASVRLRASEEVTQEGGGQGEEGISEQQEVLQGEGDPSTTPTDSLILTDGAPEGQSTDDEMQDSQLVDGVGEDDTGIGIETDKSMLLNDGAPALQLQNAATRLAASFNKLTAAQGGDKNAGKDSKKKDDGKFTFTRKNPLEPPKKKPAGGHGGKVKGNKLTASSRPIPGRVQKVIKLLHSKGLDVDQVEDDGEAVGVLQVNGVAMKILSVLHAAPDLVADKQKGPGGSYMFSFKSDPKKALMLVPRDCTVHFDY